MGRLLIYLVILIIGIILTLAGNCIQLVALIQWYLLKMKVQEEKEDDKEKRIKKE